MTVRHYINPQILLNLIQARNVTKQQLSDATGISVTSINHYLGQRQCIRLSNARLIANYLNIPVKMLIRPTTDPLDNTRLDKFAADQIKKAKIQARAIPLPVE